MDNRLITKEVYGVFKQYAYKMYLLSLKKEDPNLLDKYRIDIHRKYNNQAFDKILESTFSFPYDKELFDYLAKRKLSPQDVEETMNEFGISFELLTDKIREYVTYSYYTVREKGLLGPRYVKELSAYYDVKKSEKSNKSVAF